MFEHKRSTSPNCSTALCKCCGYFTAKVHLLFVFVWVLSTSLSACVSSSTYAIPPLRGSGLTRLSAVEQSVTQAGFPVNPVLAYMPSSMTAASTNTNLVFLRSNGNIWGNNRALDLRSDGSNTQITTLAQACIASPDVDTAGDYLLCPTAHAVWALPMTATGKAHLIAQLPSGATVDSAGVSWYQPMQRLAVIVSTANFCEALLYEPTISKLSDPNATLTLFAQLIFDSVVPSLPIYGYPAEACALWSPRWGNDGQTLYIGLPERTMNPSVAASPTPVLTPTPKRLELPPAIISAVSIASLVASVDSPQPNVGVSIVHLSHLTPITRHVGWSAPFAVINGILVYVDDSSRILRAINLTTGRNSVALALSNFTVNNGTPVDSSKTALAGMPIYDMLALPASNQSAQIQVIFTLVLFGGDKEIFGGLYRYVFTPFT